jgi:formylglycine-generating enzyme required for sulfatase activity
VLWLALRGYMVAKDELPRHTVTLPSFYVGRYPVTNAEYACFVEAGGYADERYWPTPAARAWLQGEDGGALVQQWMNIWQAIQADPEKTLTQLKRAGVTPQQMEAFEQLAAMSEPEVEKLVSETQAERPRDRPAFWDDARYNNPAQPVVGVTWFEALAYTRWLQQQLQGAGCTLKVWKDGERVDVSVEPGTLHVHLPSEIEWEAAARGQRGRRYPWGGRWQAARANTWEGHVLRPTPVDVYPQGRTPEGLADMAGNVWEWTRSLYQAYPYDSEDGREALEAEGYRVLRGGSWLADPRVARCAYRDRSVPVPFYPDLGFRVVVSLARF